MRDVANAFFPLDPKKLYTTNCEPPSKEGGRLGVSKAPKGE